MLKTQQSQCLAVPCPLSSCLVSWVRLKFWFWFQEAVVFMKWISFCRTDVKILPYTGEGKPVRLSITHLRAGTQLPECPSCWINSLSSGLLWHHLWERDGLPLAEIPTFKALFCPLSMVEIDSSLQLSSLLLMFPKESYFFPTGFRESGCSVCSGDTIMLKWSHPHHCTCAGTEIVRKFSLSYVRGRKIVRSNYILKCIIFYFY